MKTSESDPIRVNELPIGGGVLGMTFCPGKHDTSLNGVAWARNLHADLDALRDWGASTIVTVMQRDELDLLRVPDLGPQVRARGMNWHHLPVLDQSVPNRDFPRIWANLTKLLQRELAAGRKIVVHCRGGLGRTGLIAALLLMDMGHGARDAMSRVRQVRSARAIETPEQEDYVRRYAPYLSHASLLAGAIGDSLGADIEFRKLDHIRARFPVGVNQLAQTHAVAPGWFTDDTQMTLFTAEGMIRFHVARHLNGHASDAEIVHMALLRWYATQGYAPTCEIDRQTGLIAHREMWYQAAPGNTCLSALGASKVLGEAAENDSKGCGSIMRVAPIALAMPADRVKDCALRTSSLTHGHPVGQLAAAAWAELLSEVASGQDLGSAAQQIARHYIAFSPETAAVGWSIRAALNARRDGRPETVETLGGGWVAEEALAIALYAAMCADSFEQGLQIAVTHSGDSDSTGAIAGNMLGLLFPNQVFSHPWAQQVGGREMLAQLAVDLPMARYWAPEEAAQQVTKYPSG